MRRGIWISILLCIASLQAMPVKSNCGGRSIGGMTAAGVSAKDYIQDGLVAMWDGIENAGWGVHDPNATAWKELISGTDCSLFGDILTSYSWTDNSLVRIFESNGYFVYDASSLLQDAFRAATFTIEAVTSRPVNTASWQAQIINICQTSQLDTYGQGIIARFRRENNGTMGPLGTAPYTSGAGLTLDSVDALATFSCAYNSGQWVSYLGGKQKSTGTATPDSTIKGIHIRLGSSAYGFRGHYHSVRIYSRALTAAEIARNYAIDKERFGLP